MGGFILCDGDWDKVLKEDDFHNQLKRGKIAVPKLSAKDIAALGKADRLSKLFAIRQMLWFILQCISRTLQGLVVMELELVTLAFAVLNGFIYCLWWHKPLDTSFHIRVITLGPVQSFEGMQDSEQLDLEEESPTVDTMEPLLEGHSNGKLIASS